MRTKTILSLVGAALTLVAAPAAAQFRASDLIYVPAIANTTGANESVWLSDVTITNVEAEDSIDVTLIFIPTGVSNNSYLFNDRSRWLGGRAADEFGTIDESLADIPPGGFVTLEGLLAGDWPNEGGTTGQGSLVVFSYLADSLEPDGSREYRNCTVSSRTFNIGTLWQPDPDNEGEFIETETTFGQGIEGVPWYNLADGGFRDDETGIDYSYLLLDGGQQTDRYRYNLGLVNTSDRQTTLTLLIQPFTADGEPLLNESENELNYIAVLPPLANVLYYAFLDSALDQTEVEAVRFKVSILEWATSGPNPHPTFTAYGSLVDNSSNDPTTYAPTFATPYNVECMWPTDDGGKRAATMSRPLEVPPAR